jgi:branched-chain amino acid transport system substrate-binding protein
MSNEHAGSGLVPIEVANDRRRFIAGAASLGAAALLGRAPAVLAQSKSPLRIGALNSYSKVFAAIGAANLNAMTMYFEQQGGTIAGRKVEIIKEDDEINPQVGLQKLKKLVESDKVDIVIGIQASNVAMASVEYFKQSGTPFLCSGAGASQLGYVNVPNIYRCSVSSQQINSVLGEWSYDNAAKELVATASDFVGGRDTVGEFKAAFLRKGGKITKEIYPPLGNSDFSAYLADIRSLAPPATFNFYAGTDAVRFVKQYAEYGLKAKMKTLASGFMVESDVLPAQGKDALGILNAMHYADTLTNAENVKFVADYRAKYKEFPSVYAEYGWVAAKCLHEALMKTDGNTQDKDKFLAALGGVKFNAPRGPFAFNPQTHGPIHNIYIREVVDVDGRIDNKVIATFPNVRETASRS